MKREKQMGEAPAVLWREEKKTLTLCGEPVLEETLAWPEFEGKGRAVRRMTGYYRRLVRSCRLRWERETYCLACLRLAACREESRVFRPWQAGLTGEVAMEGADLLSIRMELREVRGDGRPLLSCSGVTWDWKAGAPVPLGMLLPEAAAGGDQAGRGGGAPEWELSPGPGLEGDGEAEISGQPLLPAPGGHRALLSPVFSGPGGRGGALLPGAPGGGCVDGGGRDSLRDIKLGHGRIPLI